MMRSFKDILKGAEGSKPRRLVTSFCEPDLNLICRATAAGFIIPCLIGDGKAIGRLIARSPLAYLDHEIIDETDPAGVIRRAISLIRDGRADILMQGSTDYDALLNALLDPGTGLLKGKAASYLSIFELPGVGGKLIFVTDTFLNSYPDLTAKRLILENALSFSAILGINAPKVAVLAAIEQVNPGIPSTLDAAILSKMSDRGQFGRAVVDGPLDMDCALSSAAAKRKGVRSPVTGDVDIYLVPEVDTGRLLAESLVCVGKMPAVGMLLGTICPVILDVPFVPEECRLVEVALACLARTKGEENG